IGEPLYRQAMKVKPGKFRNEIPGLSDGQLIRSLSNRCRVFGGIGKGVHCARGHLDLPDGFDAKCWRATTRCSFEVLSQGFMPRLSQKIHGRLTSSDQKVQHAVFAKRGPKLYRCSEAHVTLPGILLL